jgi:hypothetical protein
MRLLKKQPVSEESSGFSGKTACQYSLFRFLAPEAISLRSGLLMTSRTFFLLLFRNSWSLKPLIIEDDRTPTLSLGLSFVSIKCKSAFPAFMISLALLWARRRLKIIFFSAGGVNPALPFPEFF